MLIPGRECLRCDPVDRWLTGENLLCREAESPQARRVEEDARKLLWGGEHIDSLEANDPFVTTVRHGVGDNVFLAGRGN